MVITGLFRATTRLPRGRAGGIVAATAVPLAAVLLAGCSGGGGGGAQQLAAKAGAQSNAAEAAVRTMRVEKRYKDPKGNRFTIEVAIGPLKDGGVCADLSPDDTYGHSLLLTISSQTAKSKEVRLPRIAVENRAVTFTTADKSGIVCSTVMSDSDKTVLHGGQIKEIQALVSRPRNPAADLVLTIWPPGKPQTELLRIPFRSLP
jgi:hypothetical protein